jgi:hypothetical protein
MRQVLWTYDEANNDYDLIAPFLEIGDSEIEQWEGLWVRVEKTCSLVLPRPGSVGVSAVSSAGESGRDGWMAKLVARGRGGVDGDNYFGVSPRIASAGPLVSPPGTPEGVDIAFTGGSGAPTAGAFSAVEARELSWEMTVSGSPGESIEVWCPNPDQIPRGWSVALIDEAAGSAVEMRRGARYRVDLRESESRRPLTLRLTHTGGLLTLSGVSASATGVGGAQIAFTLSAAADCTVEVMNIAGRVVRVVERGVPRPAGASRVIWDGRSNGGLPVPAGMYLVRVAASGESGTRTQAMRTLSVMR